VLAVGNGHVIYSKGGDSHRECQVKTFVRWLQEKPLTEAEQAEDA
jgi:hypothetical protein